MATAEAISVQYAAPLVKGDAAPSILVLLTLAGVPVTGLTSATTGLAVYYALKGAAAVSTAPASLAAITTAWASGGFKEVDATHMPGVYRLDLAIGVVAAAGEAWIGITTTSATDPAFISLKVEDVQNQSMQASQSLALSDVAPTMFIKLMKAGVPVTGLAYNSTGVTINYALSNAAAVAITPATLAAITTAWAAGGFKEVDATKCPGIYRLDLPTAVVAALGIVIVTAQFTATDMATALLKVTSSDASLATATTAIAVNTTAVNALKTSVDAKDFVVTVDTNTVRTNN